MKTSQQPTCMQQTCDCLPLLSLQEEFEVLQELLYDITAGIGHRSASTKQNKAKQPSSGHTTSVLWMWNLPVQTSNTSSLWTGLCGAASTSMGQLRNGVVESFVMRITANPYPPGSVGTRPAAFAPVLQPFSTTQDEDSAAHISPRAHRV